MVTINSADVYASRALFVKLWPKLLKASAVEAVAELNKDVEMKPIRVKPLRHFWLSQRSRVHQQKT